LEVLFIYPTGNGVNPGNSEGGGKAENPKDVFDI
jgi:hypothetical protein